MVRDPPGNTTVPGDDTDIARGGLVLGLPPGTTKDADMTYKHRPPAIGNPTATGGVQFPVGHSRQPLSHCSVEIAGWVKSA